MRSTFIAVPLLALAASAGALAQTQKIAVVDMQGALLQTKDGQKAAAELKAKYQPKEAEFTKRGQDLTAKQDQYRKSANTMSEEAKAAADRDMQLAQRNLQRDADDTKADFQQEENRLLGGIMSKMQAVMTKYANDNQLTMIVDISTQPNNLLYADKSANITEQIIALYDKSQTSSAPAASAPATKPAPTGTAPAVRKPAPATPPK